MLLFIFVIAFMLGEGCTSALGTDLGPKMPLIVNGSRTYYYGLTHQGTAVQAESFCRKHNMDLLSIETQEEHLFLQQSLLSYLDLNTAQQTFIWTSGKRVDGDRWIWEATGRPVHYKNWWAEQPDNDGGIENCLELWYKPEFPGQIKWNDIYCNNTSRYFICEYNNKDANMDNVY